MASEFFPNHSNHREFDEGFFVGAGCARPNEKSPFEGCGASRHSPQMGIIELTVIRQFNILIG
jgi:hypothetical protein